MGLPVYQEHDLGGLTALDYWLMLKPWFRQILVVTAIAVALTAVVRGFVFTQWYRAEAILRPASQEGPTSPLAMMYSNSPLLSTFSSLMSATGLTQQTPSDAADQMSTMGSYDFTLHLVESHKLVPIITQKSFLRQLIDPLVRFVAWVESFFVAQGGEDLWKYYEIMQDRFDQDFDYKEGNLTIGFMDPDPDIARKVLGYYIQDLRAKLRNRAIVETHAAVEALFDAMRSTSDPTITTQIAMLLAQEIQQEKTAEVQADFAFLVIQMPAVPDYTHRPNVTLECAIVGVLVPLCYIIGIVFYRRIYVPARERARMIERVEDPLNGAVSVRTPAAENEPPVSEKLGL